MGFCIDMHCNPFKPQLSSAIHARTAGAYQADEENSLFAAASNINDDETKSIFQKNTFNKINFIRVFLPFLKTCKGQLSLSVEPQ